MMLGLLASLVVLASAVWEGPRAEGWRLIQTGSDLNHTQWMSPQDIEALPRRAGPMHGTPFMDVTDYPNVPPRQPEVKGPPKKLRTAEELAHILSHINMDNPTANLQVLTGETSNFANRKHNTNDGKLSAEWINDKMAEYCLQYRSSTCSSALFHHTRTPQPSVITKLVGSNPSLPHVIIGAHLDSTASGNSAPGADDDGTGTVTVMEALRAFIANPQLQNAATLEFHMYAAEEVGLWGSNDVANNYRSNNVPVKSMLQFDMNGCCSASSGLNRGTQYNVCTDSAFTDVATTARLRDAISEVGGMPQGNFNYGYAASDHASWARAGYPACHVKENVNYPPIHSANDRFANIDFTYLERFIQVALTFAINESGA